IWFHGLGVSVQYFREASFCSWTRRRYIGTAFPSFSSELRGKRRYFNAGTGAARGETLRARSITQGGVGLSWARRAGDSRTTKRSTDHWRCRIMRTTFSYEVKKPVCFVEIFPKGPVARKRPRLRALNSSPQARPLAATSNGFRQSKAGSARIMDRA